MVFIKHTFVGMLTKEKIDVVVCDTRSPNSGYTQRHADEDGRSYAQHRAQERLGDHDIWQWRKSMYVNSQRG